MLHVVAGGSWIGRLVAFVDFDSADPISNEFVILRVGELLFVQYNRAKDFNAGTSLHQDEVVVVAGEGGLGSSSVLLAGLGTGEAYSWNGMTIEVCSLGFNPSRSMDYADIAVYPMGTMSTCTLTMPTPRPSHGETTPAPVADTPVTLFPTFLSGAYRTIFAAAVGDAVHDPQTPQYRAAEWIINEDPSRLPPDDPSLLQRYLCALFWVVTTNDGERPWRSCNPPQDEETTECEFLRFSQGSETIVFVRETAVRWLTGENECEWVGNICDDNLVTRAFELCKSIGIQLLDIHTNRC